jgi:ABC-2 type transport system permease protein
MKSFHRIAAITRKEWHHILRDSFTLIMALGLPVVLVLVFGVAFEFNLSNINLAVHDGDRSGASRVLIETFGSSAFFKIEPVENTAAVLHRLSSEKARAALIIPPGFEKKVMSGAGGSVQILIDGSDNTTAGSVIGYLTAIRSKAQQRLTGAPQKPPLAFKTRYLFNPELRTPWFIVPGLSVVILSILSILLTSLTIAREWENGSMELLLSTPVRPIEIIVGKLVPYIVLGLGSVVFVYLTSTVIFAVPFHGNLMTYALGCLLFIASCTAQGLLISVVTRSQQLSMQIAIVSGLLPSIFLSEFIYPIANMPKFFHYFTVILPSRWFMQITREIYLKGTTISELTEPFAAMVAICLVLMLIAAIKFKKDIEP